MKAVSSFLFWVVTAGIGADRRQIRARLSDANPVWRLRTAVRRVVDGFLGDVQAKRFLAGGRVRDGGRHRTGGRRGLNGFLEHEPHNRNFSPR